MKSLTKILYLLLITVFTCSALCFVACDNDKQSQNEWDGRTYTVYIYLEDGVTPASGIGLAICYNVSDTSSTCLAPKKTDAEGKIEVTLPEGVEIVGKPVVHFLKDGITGTYLLPDGYGMPSNVEKIVMNHEAGASASVIEACTYEYAAELSSAVTKFSLAKN